MEERKEQILQEVRAEAREKLALIAEMDAQVELMTYQAYTLRLKCMKIVEGNDEEEEPSLEELEASLKGFEAQIDHLSSTKVVLSSALYCKIDSACE
jgi:hypothetical protein